MKMFSIFRVLGLSLLLAHCGGASILERTLVFQESDLALLSELASESESRVSVKLFEKLASNERGDAVSEEAFLELYHESQGLWSATVSASSGTYLLQLQRVTGTEISSLIAQADVEVNLEEVWLEVDLSQVVWDTNFDDDLDGLLNITEWERGTNLQVGDTDGDGVIDRDDVFPLLASEFLDTDGDSWGDFSDNCPFVSNFDQLDGDRDGSGDACDFDVDSDGVEDNEDNCVFVSNSDQTDDDLDGIGDVCDDLVEIFEEPVPDQDGDLVFDDSDNCVAVNNPDQVDRDGDGWGDVCDDDRDGDGVANSVDNCPDSLASESLVGEERWADQTDADGDGWGVVCDCDEADATFHPEADDPPDFLSRDTNCDGIDGDKERAVFVSSTGIATPESSSLVNPTSSFTEALEWAVASGLDVYVAAGDYVVTSLALSSSVQIVGGYSPDFSLRTPDLDTGELARLLIDATTPGPPFILVEGEGTDVGFTSLILESVSSFSYQTLVEIQQAAVSLSDVEVRGSDQAVTEILIEAVDASVSFERSFFQGEASGKSVGLDAEESVVTVHDMVTEMGDAFHTIAFDVFETRFDLSDSAIDSGQHAQGSVQGIMLEASEVTVTNSTLAGYSQDSVAPIRCVGLPEFSSVDLQSNVFERYSYDSREGEESGFNFGAYLTCEGGEVLNTTELLESGEFGELVAERNVVGEEFDFVEWGLGIL